MADEQLDYGDREYAGAQKMQFQGGGAIAALVDDEIIGEDDEYDDLYNDVNVGDGFLQHHNAEAPVPSAGAGTGGFQVQRAGMLEPRPNATQPQQLNVQERMNELPGERGMLGTTDKGGVNGMNHGAQMSNPGFQGPAPVPQKPGVGPTPTGMTVKLSAEPVPSLNSGSGDPRSVQQQVPPNQMAMNVNTNVNRPMANENQVRPPLENGGTMLFVGELHWWTTDAELESVLSQFGRVKEIKFFDERASGKSKGYCQVEFYESAAAASCKEGMDGHVFNGRPCVVAFASPHTMRQMANSYASKTANQTQSQQPQGRRPMNDGMGRGGPMNQQGGDGGRGFGRGGWGRGGQGILNRGPGDGHMRGRGGPMGGRNNMMGNFNGVGPGGNGGAFGQGLPGPGFGGPPGGLMHPQGMMGGGFDPTYMGRGAGYGGFSGPPFPGMMPQFPGVNMGLAGVAPHVNPAFFGRGMVPNGMGMMGPTGMEGPHGGMWTDTSMGGWGGDEQGQRTRESSYGGDDGASEYGYGEGGREKVAKSNTASKEKERGHERDWSGNSEKRNRDEREPERDRSDRDHRYREEKDGYRDHRQRERDVDYEDDWDRGQSSRSRSRSKAIPEEDYRRSRDSDYGKRRRLPSE